MLLTRCLSGESNLTPLCLCAGRNQSASQLAGVVLRANSDIGTDNIIRVHFSVKHRRDRNENVLTKSETK